MDIDINTLSEGSRRFLLYKTNEWNCSPSQAYARILDERASKDLPKIEKRIAAGKGEPTTATS